MKRIIAIVCLASGAAYADNKGRADELFKHAKKLLAEHNYAEACAKFEESYKLDPGIGGELNIGRCYEEWGRLAHAYRAYVEAQKTAKAQNDPRQAKIQELIAALDPQVPRLVLHIPAGVDPATVTVAIDGTPVPSSDLANPQLVDPGPKQIEYSIAGVTKDKTVPVERGATIDVTLEAHAPEQHVAHTAEPPAQHQQPAQPQPEPSEPHPGRTLRIAGIAVGAVGVVGVAVGSYLALSARSNYRNALATDCMGMTDACDSAGLSATHDARSRANAATGVFIGGLALVAGGAIMYFIAPHAARSEHAFYLAPTGTGIAFGGRY